METLALLEMSVGLQLQEVAWEQPSAARPSVPSLRCVRAMGMPPHGPRSTVIVLHGVAITVASEL